MILSGVLSLIAMLGQPEEESNWENNYISSIDCFRKLEMKDEHP